MNKITRNLWIFMTLLILLGMTACEKEKIDTQVYDNTLKLMAKLYAPTEKNIKMKMELTSVLDLVEEVGFYNPYWSRTTFHASATTPGEIGHLSINGYKTEYLPADNKFYFYAVKSIPEEDSVLFFNTPITIDFKTNEVAILNDFSLIEEHGLDMPYLTFENLQNNKIERSEGFTVHAKLDAANSAISKSILVFEGINNEGKVVSWHRFVDDELNIYHVKPEEIARFEQCNSIQITLAQAYNKYYHIVSDNIEFRNTVSTRHRVFFAK